MRNTRSQGGAAREKQNVTWENPRRRQGGECRLLSYFVDRGGSGAIEMRQKTQNQEMNQKKQKAPPL